MEQLVRFGEYYAASRLYQAHGSAEVVVYRCSFEETLFHAFPLACLVVEALQDDRKVLHQEDTAKDGYQQFLVNNVAYTAMIPPMVRLPVSPMNTWAG